MFIIGIDPHKGSHTAAVLDRTETVMGELRVSADRRHRDKLLRFAASFTPRTWAIESASGLGALLAQQLVAAGETVLDVPPTLSARVRLLDAGCTDIGTGLLFKQPATTQNAPARRTPPGAGHEETTLMPEPNVRDRLLARSPSACLS